MWSTSWSNRRSARGLGIAGLCAAALLLSACGFQPLYGSPGDGRPGPAEELAAIRIAPLPDRTGQQMHNLLRDRLNPNGQPRDAAYLLVIALSEAKQELGIRKDETATRANLILSADFSLREAASQKVLFSGVASSTNSYNILTNHFATLFAEKDARERALRELSEDIRTRLAVYFSQPRRAEL